jgi:hypothetical protein
MAVQYATNAKLRETWDRLALLLIVLPREGWEHEFRTITHRKIYRLTLLEENEAGHDE